MSNPTTYSVYRGAKPYQVQLDPNSTLGEVRSTLEDKGIMKKDDAFLYRNQATGYKTIFPMNDMDRPLSVVLFPSVKAAKNDHKIIELISVSATTPGLLGEEVKTGWLQSNPYFGATVRLNTTDDVAKANNKGMFAPILLTNIQSANPNSPFSFYNAVVVQKGAIVEFGMYCWGAAGTAASITTDASLYSKVITQGLFTCYQPDDFETISTNFYWTYSGSYKYTIQIESNESMHIAQQYNVQYSTVTVEGYSLTSWTDNNGKVYRSNAKAPGDSPELDTITDVSTPFHPPEPHGKVYIPGHSVQSGAPKSGPAAQQHLTPIEAVTPPSVPINRTGGLIGSVQLYFLVFDSKEDAFEVVKVINSSANI